VVFERLRKGVVEVKGKVFVVWEVCVVERSKAKRLGSAFGWLN
jgi:hypothetical protein